ncbi:MAG: PIG-L deacetylase family protein [Acidimicrobiales bacterium]
MELTVDEDHLGQPERLWKASGRHHELQPLTWLAARRIVVVAPHPDDEVLGAGGLIQSALTHRIRVHVIAVTDGEGSHPHSNAPLRFDLASVRVLESRVALRRLGWVAPEITQLHLPDSNVSRHREQLDEALQSMLRPGDLCVAPWHLDGHPDHDACGESALTASRRAGVPMIGYLVWAWHWADPCGSDIPWGACRRLDLSRRQSARKRWSTGAFRSQTEPLGPEAADAPILPAPMMRRFWRNYEVYVDGASKT